MWCVLVRYSQSLAIHASFLVHANSLLWLFGINVALLSLAKVTSLQMELCLVHKHFSH